MERDFKGVWIPKDIWEDDGLGWSEKLIYVEIDSLAGKKPCYASNAYLASFFKLSKDRVSKIITSLNNKGYIKVELEYLPGTKTVKRRHITPIPYRRKHLYPIGENADTPIGENAEENNTELSNTDNSFIPVFPNRGKVIEIMQYLNSKTGKRFETGEVKPPAKAYLSVINARVKEKRPLEEFKTIIDYKVAQWGEDERMSKYLTPETLFRASNFDKYLEEIRNDPDYETEEEKAARIARMFAEGTV